MGNHWDDEAERAVIKLGPAAAPIRTELRRYMRHAVGKGYEVAEAVALLHEHATLGGDEHAHADQLHRAHCVAATVGARRVLIGFGAAAHAVGEWSPAEVAQDLANAGYPIVGQALMRMMIPIPFGEADSAVMERLIGTLTDDELVALVCHVAAMTGSLGFRQADIAALDPSRDDQGDQQPAHAVGDYARAAADRITAEDAVAENPETD